METAILTVDLTNSLQGIPQSSLTSDGSSIINNGEKNFPEYFSEVMGRETACKADSSDKGNFVSGSYGDNDYSENTLNPDLGVKLPYVVDSNTMEVKDIAVTEMSAALFLSLIGFNIGEIDAALQNAAGEINQSPDINKDIKAVDFLKRLGFSEDDAKDIVAQVINQVNPIFNSGQIEKTGEENSLSKLTITHRVSGDTEKINSENSIMPLLKLSNNHNEIVNNIKQIVSNEPQQKTAPNIGNAFSEPVLETLQKGDSINPLRIEQTDSEAFISNKLENVSLLGVSKDSGISVDLLPAAKISTGEVKTVKLSDKGGNAAPLVSATPQAEGKEQNIDSDLSGGDNFSLSAKEYAVLKQGDSPSKAGVENIAQPQKTIIDKAVINQIVEKAAIFIRGEKNEIKIHLEPPSLGSIHMKVAMESHNMKATMIADTPYVKEVIESSLGELKRSLSESGIKVDQFSVFVGNGYDYKNGGYDLIPHMERAEASEIESINSANKKIEAVGNTNSQNIINIFV